MLPAWDKCGYGAEQIGLHNPEGWGEGVAAGVPWSHSRAHKLSPELGAEHTVSAEFFEEGVALEDKTVVKGVPKRSLEASVVADLSMDPVAY